MDIKLNKIEQLRFVEKLKQEFFEEILKLESLETDETRLIDFIPVNDISYAEKKLNNGKYQFKISSR